MEFIEFTGSKPAKAGGPSTTYRHHGLFKCPVCETSVERALSTGKRNKSCGNKECRKIAGNFRGTLKPSTTSNITTNPYYTNIATLHAKLKHTEEYTLVPEWLVLATFFNSIIEQYTEFRARNKGVRITMAIPDSSEPVGPGNFSLAVYTREYTKTKKYGGKPGSLYCYLYLLECKGLYKIGIAEDVAKRVKSLSTGNPFSISVVYNKFTSSPRALEAYLHRVYKDKAYSGEWFSLDSEDVEDIIEYIENSVDASNIWVGDTIVIHNSVAMATHTFKDTAAREYCITEKYNNNLKGPKAATIAAEGCVVPIVPSKLKRVRASSSPMYSSWLTIKSNVRKGYTKDSGWETFEQYRECMEDAFSLVPSPVITVEGTHYSEDTITYKTRAAFSSNAKAVVAFKDGVEVGQYVSAKEASVALECTPGHITACCKGHRALHKGFMFRYLDKH